MKKILTLILLVLPFTANAEVHLKSSWLQVGYMDNGTAVPVKNQVQESTISIYDDGIIRLNSLLITPVDSDSYGDETYIIGYTPDNKKVAVKIVWRDDDSILAIVFYNWNDTYVTYMGITK